MEILWLFQKTQWTNTSRWHCTPDNHKLWKINTGLQATWAMSFSTLLPDSRTLVSKWNTKLALIWKEDFGPLGNSPVLLLLSPGKTPLTTTVAKFLDTSVCGGSWCLDPSLSPFLVKFTQILESMSSGQLSVQQSSPWLCNLVNQTERPFWRLRKPLQVFWVD